jgi:serine/threonine-protein kinase
MPAPSPPPSPVAEGDVLAKKYRVDRVIGVGGMGVVVAATHLALKQKVALKLMLPSAMSSGESVERFLREARAVARLQSVHVPRVVDVGTLDTGEPYMVMELLEGEDLGHLLDRCGPLGGAEAMEYVRQACEALVEAHALGIVHRDLKPDNLFLARDPKGRPLVKLLDFGISKSMDRDAVNLSLTRTSAVMGSPFYMSPEQMRASRDVDARTDIWSLGVTLYELVVGELPFKAESAMALGAVVLHEVPVPPKERRPDVSPALNDVILRCLEKSPERRYSDAAALSKALEDAGASAEGAPVRRLPSTRPRVTLGAGGTPPTGSRTLQFSETQAAERPARSAWTTVAVVAAGVGVAVAVTFGVVRARQDGPSVDGRAPGSTLPAQAASASTAAPVVSSPASVEAPVPSSSVAASTSASASSSASARPATSSMQGPGIHANPPHVTTPPATAIATSNPTTVPPAPTPTPSPAHTNPLDHL